MVGVRRQQSHPHDGAVDRKNLNRSAVALSVNTASGIYGHQLVDTVNGFHVDRRSLSRVGLLPRVIKHDPKTFLDQVVKFLLKC